MTLRLAVLIALTSVIAACSGNVVCPGDDAPITDAQLIQFAIDRELERHDGIAQSAEAFLTAYPACCSVQRHVRRYDEFSVERAYRAEAARLHVRPTAVVRLEYMPLDGPYETLSYYWLGSCGEILEDL
jgi:hypothetical protein